MDVFALSALETRVDVRRDESALSISSGEEKAERPDGMLCSGVSGHVDDMVISHVLLMKADGTHAHTHRPAEIFTIMVLKASQAAEV